MTERTEKQIGIWAKHETEENLRSKKRKYVFCRIGGKDKTEVHLMRWIECVGETVVVVAMVVDNERERDRRGRVRGGQVGVSGGGGKGRGGGGRRLFIEEGHLVVEEGRLVVEGGGY